jgi:hypothetical protein
MAAARTGIGFFSRFAILSILGEAGAFIEHTIT